MDDSTPTNTGLGTTTEPQNLRETTTPKPEKKQKNTKWILFIVLALVIGGAAGFVIGQDLKESEMKDQYGTQIEALEDEVEDAKIRAGDTLEDGQEAVTEGQQTLESLQAENATLKTTIEEQNAKIADLEKQLQEAQGSGTPTN